VGDRDERRLADIAEAIAAIESHLTRGELSDGLIFDAVRIRLLEIGEAVKALSREATAAEPQIPWSQIARMRDHLAHRYFDTSHAIVQATLTHDIPHLRDAIARLRNHEPR
jgi:uncharacterized protein with HEPN domain